MGTTESNTNPENGLHTSSVEHDYLTGLANRRGLYDYYDSLDKNHVLHAMFIDIDNFKRVNDIYGHSMGDKLLIAISHLIQNHARSFTSRIGGDEYVVLLNGELDTENVEHTASDLISNMERIDFRTDILSLSSIRSASIFNRFSLLATTQISSTDFNF